MMKQSWLFYLSSWFWPQTQVFVLLKKQTLVFVAVKHEASLKHRMDSSAKWQTCFCWFASFSEITLLQFGVRAASYQTQCYSNAFCLTTPGTSESESTMTQDLWSSFFIVLQHSVCCWIFSAWFLFLVSLLFSFSLVTFTLCPCRFLSYFVVFVVAVEFWVLCLVIRLFSPVCHFWPAVSFPICWNLCQSKAWFVFYSIVWVCVFGSKPFTARSTSAVFNV